MTFLRPELSEKLSSRGVETEGRKRDRKKRDVSLEVVTLDRVDNRDLNLSLWVGRLKMDDNVCR